MDVTFLTDIFILIFIIFNIHSLFMIGRNMSGETTLRFTNFATQFTIKLAFVTINYFIKFFIQKNNIVNKTRHQLYYKIHRHKEIHQRSWPSCLKCALSAGRQRYYQLQDRKQKTTNGLCFQSIFSDDRA